MSTINAYAATTAKAPLEPFSFDAGELGAEEVEIKVTHCGICHSDLSMLDNDWGMTRFPFVPGHEAVGTVTALGSGAKGLKIGQHVGIGWSAYSCLSCHECLSGVTTSARSPRHHRGTPRWLCRQTPGAVDLGSPSASGAGHGHHGPAALRGHHRVLTLLRVRHPCDCPGGHHRHRRFGHMALQFANKWGCEVHAFTTSESKEEEARKLGAHHVHNTKNPGALRKIAGSLDLIISTINVPLDLHSLLGTLAPTGRLHVVGAVVQPMPLRAMDLISGLKSVSGSPTGSPTVIDAMLNFSARHAIAPITETYPMSQVNDALEHLRSGKARYRIVLVNE